MTATPTVVDEPIEFYKFIIFSLVMGPFWSSTNSTPSEACIPAAIVALETIQAHKQSLSNQVLVQYIIISGSFAFHTQSVRRHHHLRRHASHERCTAEG